MKRILASILAVVLLCTMAISSFAAVSSPAKEDDTTRPLKPGDKFVLDPGKTDGKKVEIPIDKEAYDENGKGLVVTYTDEDGNKVVASNSFDENGNMIGYDLPTGVELTLEDITPDFEDVDPDKWYASAADYAVAHSFLIGYGDGLLHLEDGLTDAATYNVINRVLGGKGFEGAGWDTASIDDANTAGYAIEPVEGAITRGQLVEILDKVIGGNSIEAGLLIGDENGELNLTENLIRAEIATVAERLVAYLHK